MGVDAVLVHADQPGHRVEGPGVDLARIRWACPVGSWASRRRRNSPRRPARSRPPASGGGRSPDARRPGARRRPDGPAPWRSTGPAARSRGCRCRSPGCPHRRRWPRPRRAGWSLLRSSPSPHHPPPDRPAKSPDGRGLSPSSLAHSGPLVTRCPSYPGRSGPRPRPWVAGSGRSGRRSDRAPLCQLATGGHPNLVASGRERGPAPAGGGLDAGRRTGDLSRWATARPRSRAPHS